MESQIATVLTEYSELDYKWDVEKNHFYQNKKRYGVRPLFADELNLINKKYAALQQFEIILTNEFVNQQTDEGLQAAIFELYDAASEVIKQLDKTKGGLPAIIFNINPFSIGEAEPLDESDGVVVLRIQFTVQYRENLN